MSNRDTMAQAIRSKSLYKSMLPTIKCSSCGDDIEISMMGEHICSSGDDADHHLNGFNHDRRPSVPDVPAVPPLPKLDHVYINQPEVIPELDHEDMPEFAEEDYEWEDEHEHEHGYTYDHHYNQPPEQDSQHEHGHEHSYDHNHNQPPEAENQHEHSYDHNHNQPFEPEHQHDHEYEPREALEPKVESETTLPSPQLGNPAHSYSRPARPKPPPLDAVAANNFDAFRGHDTLVTATSAAMPDPQFHGSPGTLDYPPRSATGSGSLGVPLTPSFAPLSPRSGSSENLLKRMDTIASGPFSTTRKPSDAGSELLGAERPEPRRMESNEIIGIRADETTSPFGTAHPPLSPAVSRISPLPSPLSNEDPSYLPQGPPPPRPNRPENVDGLMDALSETGKEALIDPLASGGIENITAIPEQNPQPVNLHEMMSKSARSSMSSVKDEHKKGNNEGPPPTDNPPNRFSQMLPGSSFEPAVPEKPPQPNTGITRKLTSLLRSKSQRRRHMTNESASSNDSKSAFGDSAASIRSSPPTSNASSFSPIKQSLDDLIGASINPTGSGHIPRKLSTESTTSSGSAANFSRPRALEPLDPVLEVPDRDESREKYAPPLQIPEEEAESYFANAPPTPVDSPMDPAMGDGMMPEMMEDMGSYDEYQFADPSPPLSPPGPILIPVRSHSLRQPRLPETTPPMPRAKGTCRGCNQPIFGKSVKAADGRITGRYHRQCFVCRTCKKQFATADFYVIKNQPYCAHHYHVLNHSLCYNCNQGIEGAYAETQEPNEKRRRKYHLQCFRCLDCSCLLEGDYFEINGRFYCEQDAVRVHNETSRLSPGKRFPERRTTKLMMMA